MPLPPNTVWCRRSPAPSYGPCPTNVDASAPELPDGCAKSIAELTFRRLLRDARLDASRFGSRDWNPLAELISEGSRVVLKPNWVSHQNQANCGLDCLITHNSVIEAVLTFVARARPASVVIGDAPVQGCDFERLDALAGLRAIEQRWAKAFESVSVRDFRRTVLTGGTIEGERLHSARSDEDYVLFDLGPESALEPISADADRFRVTMYDPAALGRTHTQGKHQYLIAREVIEADVLISLPKLKTHRKSGLTGALKNLVGVNGLKDYLPHHRKGGSNQGGDCYEGHSRWKRLAEDALDAANRVEPGRSAGARAKVARLAMVAGRFCGHDRNLEGAWHGNDTIWRTILDLQRIVHYGTLEGRLADTPQRRVLTVTDAILAGEGEGPLAPQPVPLGMMTMGLSTAAAEWTHALLMGFDPTRLSLVKEAFTPRRYPLVDFQPDHMVVLVDGVPVRTESLNSLCGQRFLPPAGWAGHCELESSDEAVRCSA